MIRALQTCLSQDQLSPEEAARLCGKLVFLQCSLFGMVGRAAMRPLYARSHGGSSQSLVLNQGLRSAIETLIAVLARARPRRIPLRPRDERTSIVYADAFFKLGERSWRIGQQPPRHWTKAAVSSLTNGWGFLAKAGSHVTAGQGCVPAAIVERFSSKKAYIFFLEINAQILALLANREFLDSFWICFIDNTAGRAALEKGFSGEASINNLLAFFSCLCSELSWFGHFEWVASDLNPSDPISRGDVSAPVVQKARMLREVPDEYWRLLWDVAESMQYATGEAVKVASRLSFSFEA